MLDELGGWPVLSADWEPTGWEATRTLVELNRLAVTPFFKLMVDRDMKNVKQHIITVSFNVLPSLFLRSELQCSLVLFVMGFFSRAISYCALPIAYLTCTYI